MSRTPYTLGLRRRASPKKKDNMRTKRIEIRLSIDELERARQLAGARKMRVGTFIREASLHRIPPTIPPINSSASLELGRISNNLNQIARKLNAGFNIDGDAINNEIKRLRFALIEASSAS